MQLGHKLMIVLVLLHSIRPSFRKQARFYRPSGAVYGGAHL